MRLLFILVVMPFLAGAQITSNQQKAFNAYIDYANKSADEVTYIVRTIVNYYPDLHPKTSWSNPRFVCGIQLDDYYLTQANTLGKNLDATLATTLNAKIKDLRTAAELIDSKCKALDTYHKLEDYKQDNYAKAESLINETQLAVTDYKKKQTALQQALEAAHKKLTSSTPAGAYKQTDAMMRAQLEQERALLDSWTFNLRGDVYTGWPVDKLEQNILTSDAQYQTMQKFKPVLKYPASSMWSSFQGSVAMILDSKRRALNENTFESKKNDRHSNEVYLSLINYYNGTVLSEYNSFLQYAEADGYRGLKAIKYFPVVDIRTQLLEVQVTVKPFKDNAHTALTFPAQKAAIQQNVYESLLNYISFINESWRQTRNLQATVSNFSSSASYYKTLASFEKTSALRFEYKNYEVPKAEYQKTISDSKALPPAVVKSLNDQAETLYTILAELDDLNASIQLETAQKRYEKDHLDNIYKMLERQKVLFETWDSRKEILYQDIRTIFDAYPASNPKSSWYVSGQALRNLTDLDHEALFQTKKYYTVDTTLRVSTEKIDAALRDVIGREYENMKGIERIGRNNGNCPYTPYEDLPKTSKSLSEEINKRKPIRSGRYEHPYYRILYTYNEVVSEYNKFCELSKEVKLLPTIYQPELFSVSYPQKKEPAAQKPQPQQSTDQPVASQNVPPVKAETSKKRRNGNLRDQHEIRETSDAKMLHDTDTVYIERRDTVYISEPGENLRSMEGYATNNLVLLLDVSGSMNTAEKLPVLKSSVLNMLSMMRPEDKVSIIAFSGKPKVLLEFESFTERDKVTKAIERLTSSGKTDGNAALKLAYATADEHYIRAGNNRIVLATDGEFATSDDILQMIEQFSKNDIYLSIFNFGKGMGSSRALERLALLGHGNYEYISRENAELKLIREVKAKRKK
jgi:Mg-chelatase subunit ChlD